MAILWPSADRARSASAAVQALLLPLRLALTFHRWDAPPNQALDTVGEPTASNDDFDAFFQRHQQDVFGYLWRLTGEEQAAYDLSQETFLRAWQRFESIRAYDQPGAWLIRVATNLALKHLRHRGVVGQVTATLGQTGASAPGDHATQVAETLGMTRAAVKMMLCRAREQFRVRYMRQEAQ